jgi:ankyrin repeat protein
MYAVFKGNMKIIKRLVNLDVNIFELNSHGSSLLHIAIISDQVSALVYFKEKYKLDIYAKNKNGSTPLHLACFYGSESCFNVLLSWIDNSNDINEKNDEGNTPMHFLILTGILKFLFL